MAGPSVVRSASGGFQVDVKLDLREAEAQGAMFFRAYEDNLEREFRHVMTLALRAAQRFAPKGDHNYVIEDLDERRRAGGSRSPKPANPRGFAVVGSPKWRIRKVPGGTLRRALTVVVRAALAGEGSLTGLIGVRRGSPAEAYARIAELGGTIAARNVKYLRYSPDGQTVVFKPVVHRRAHPYLLPALLYVWPLLMAMPEVAFRATATELGMETL